MRHLKLSKYLTRSFVLLSIFTLAACGGGGDGGDATQSPDLPPPVLESFTFTCPNTVVQGLSGQCSGSCVTRTVDANGNVNRFTGCPSFTCQSADTSIAAIESVDDAADTCVVRGVGAGTVDITGTVTGGQATESLQVIDAAVASYVITPDPVVTPVGGVQQALATTTFTDGTKDINPVNTSWTTADTNTATVGNGGANQPAGEVRGQSVGATTLRGVSKLDAAFEDTVAVQVNDARIVTGTLCVRPEPAGYVAPGPNTPICRAFDAVADVCPVVTTTININNSARFVAFAQFDNNTYCDLTQGVTWDLDPAIAGATLGGADPSNPINSNTLVDGQVLAGDTTGSTNVTARFVVPAQAVDETGSAPLIIEGGGRIASNSLDVGIPVEDTNDDGVLNSADELQKVVCIGAYDLVQGLQDSDNLPAFKQAYANHRVCQDGAAAGSCAEEDFGPIATPINSTINLVSWRVGGDYFTGGQCVTSDTGPVGADNEPPITVGNSTDFSGIESRDAAVKGNMASTGPLRLGTACIEGNLSIAGVSGSAVDGLTAIVLPATSDEVLGQAVQLCNTLVPLFLLGGDEGAGAAIQLVAALSDILNPLLLALGDGVDGTGLDLVLDTVLEGISDNLTGAGAPLEPLISPILGGLVEDVLDPGLFSPVNCALGALLQGLLGGDPSEIAALAECAPSFDF